MTATTAARYRVLMTGALLLRALVGMSLTATLPKVATKPEGPPEAG
jgi:hypothetical protein